MSVATCGKSLPDIASLIRATCPLEPMPQARTPALTAGVRSRSCFANGNGRCPVARVEPPGRREAPPDDRLRETRGRSRISLSLNPGYVPASSRRRGFACRHDLVCGAPRELRHVVELEGEAAHSRCCGAHLHNQIT